MAACSVTKYIASLLGRWECTGGKKTYDLLESQSRNKRWECEEKSLHQSLCSYFKSHKIRNGSNKDYEQTILKRIHSSTGM